MRVVRSTFDSSRVHRRAATARRRLTSRPPRETPRGVAPGTGRTTLGRRARRRATTSTRIRDRPRSTTTARVRDVADGARPRRRGNARAARTNERTNERNERMTFRVVEDAIVVRETRDARARGRRRRRSPKPEVRRKSSPVASPIASLVRRRPRATTPSRPRRSWLVGPVATSPHHDGGDETTARRRRRRRRSRGDGDDDAEGGRKEGRSRCRTRATTRRRTRRWRTG